MHSRNHRLIVGVALVGLLLLPVASFGAEEIVVVKNYGNALLFVPQISADDMILTVTGPCNYRLRRSLLKDGELLFQLDGSTIDGMYRFEVTAIPKIDGSIIEVLLDARKTGDNTKVDDLCRVGALPGDPQIHTSGFSVANARIAYDPGAQEGFGGTVPKFASGTLAETAAGITTSRSAVVDQDVPSLNKDFVIIDDLIVDGSACIGFDCNNGEAFGFDTIRIKENNLRIKFDDTSVAASFPDNDWQLTANDSANGGASKFSIDDISGGRTPFTVEANARSHSLYVDDGGRIGNRTSTPSVEIHTIDGDTPTLRLQQDGSSGFAPQTWDVAGNETNFFVRDVTNGSTLPFRIRPGAPTSSIFIDVSGDVGMGTSSPDEELHILRSDTDDAFITIENSNATTQNVGFSLTNNSRTVNFFNNTNGDFIIAVAGGLGTVLEIDGPTGDVTIANDLIVTGTCTGCDAVFAPDWPLESIEDHAESMWRDSYLPAVGPTNEGETSIDVFEKVTGLLQELEKAHIYIERLNSTIKGQDQVLEALAARLTEVENGN